MGLRPGELISCADPGPSRETLIHRSVVGPRKLHVKQAFWVILMEVALRPLSGNAGLGPHPILPRRKQRQRGGPPVV